jgi:hypothetical protein
MAGTQTVLSDIVLPEIFTPYSQVLTEEKSRLVQSGALQRDAAIDALLAGGGLTFNVPSYVDLDNTDERVSTEDAHMSYVTPGADDPDPENIEAITEIAVRLNRNQSWSSNDLTADLAGTDPMAAIANRVAYYWTRRLQKLFIAVATGVFADNTANDAGDYTNDISGGAFIDGVTNFSAEAYIDARITMGDSQDALGLVFVHSVVYGRMQKNNLIEFIPDSEGRVNIPTFQGSIVVVDDGMPNAAGVYESWLFGQGALHFGVGQSKVATAVVRHEGAGNGGGQETLYNRVVWCMHPVGHSYIGVAPPNGGPTNASTAPNLADDASWDRVYPERKQIKIARLVTRES